MSTVFSNRTPAVSKNFHNFPISQDHDHDTDSDDLDTPDDQELAVPQRGGFKAAVEHYHSIPTGKAAVTSHDSDLEALLAPDTAGDTAGDSDDNFLDDLLADSVQAIEGKVKLKINRKKLLDTRVQGAERAGIEAENRLWELAREWKAVANVVIFNTQYCNCCGGQHSVLSGYFERQDHRTSKISRWQAVGKMNESLRKESKHTESVVAVCVDCAEESAWEPEAGCNYTPSYAKQALGVIPKSEIVSAEQIAEQLK